MRQKGKEKATQKEGDESNLENQLSILHNRVGRIASLLYQIIE